MVLVAFGWHAVTGPILCRPDSSPGCSGCNGTLSMLSSFLPLLPRRHPHRQLSGRCRLRLERLEGRDLPAVTVSVDASADRHAISPLIYGLAFADTTALRDLNVTFNRSGGNTTSRYNWQLNADNRGSDWYFQTI